MRRRRKKWKELYSTICVIRMKMRAIKVTKQPLVVRVTSEMCEMNNIEMKPKRDGETYTHIQQHIGVINTQRTDRTAKNNIEREKKGSEKLVQILNVFLCNSSFFFLCVHSLLVVVDIVYTNIWQV